VDSRTAQFEALRPRLFGLAYRALGSRADAEDVVQEAFLRWQKAPVEVASAQAYLMTIVSRLALDAIKSARRRREEYVGVWLPEPLVGAPTPTDAVEMAESVSMAFLFVLESLAPAERVAFLLREVFDAEYPEVAEALETSEANSRQLVARARKHVQDRRPRFEVQPERHRAALHQFFSAVAGGDMGGLLSMLREDAVTYSDGGGKAYAAINPIYGADRVARFFLGIAAKAPADASWRIEDAAGVPSLWLTAGGKLVSLITLDLDADGQITTIFVVRNPDKLPQSTENRAKTGPTPVINHP